VLRASWGQGGRLRRINATRKECIFVQGGTIDELGAEQPDMVLKHYPAVHALTTQKKWDAVQVVPPDSLRGWQKEVLDHLLQQDDRRICFVVDYEGGTGKTCLGKWIVANYQAYHCTGGKQADLAFSYKEPDYEIAIFDLARHAEDKDFHPYHFAEQLKNGMFSSGKYMSISKRITPPKVIWFMNQDPDRTKLSADRYCVHIVSKDLSDMRPVAPHFPPVVPNDILADVIDEFLNDN